MTKCKLQENAECNDEFCESEPQEGDIVVSDQHGVDMAFCDGKAIASARISQGEDIYLMIKDWMIANSYYPNVFWISDHGNSCLVSMGEYFPKRGK